MCLNEEGILPFSGWLSEQYCSCSLALKMGICSSRTVLTLSHVAFNLKRELHLSFSSACLVVEILPHPFWVSPIISLARFSSCLSLSQRNFLVRSSHIICILTHSNSLLKQILKDTFLSDEIFFRLEERKERERDSCHFIVPHFDTLFSCLVFWHSSWIESDIVQEGLLDISSPQFHPQFLFKFFLSPIQVKDLKLKKRKWGVLKEKVFEGTTFFQEPSVKLVKKIVHLFKKTSWQSFLLPHYFPTTCTSLTMINKCQ